jgi:hypothetical protein
MFKIIDATEVRGDFAGAALLRETMRIAERQLDLPTDDNYIAPT